MCTIIVFVFGIVALATGKFSLSANKEVVGTPARIVGVLLLLPLPISFAVGFAYGFLSAARNMPLNETAIQIIELVIIAVFVVAAVIVAQIYATEKMGPPPRRRAWDQDEEDEEWRRRKRRREREAREEEDEGPLDILESVPETRAVPPPLPPDAIQAGREPITVMPAPAAPPETMIATCPSCNGLCRVPTNSIGKKARCPKCQEVFQVPPPPEAGIQRKSDL